MEGDGAELTIVLAPRIQVGGVVVDEHGAPAPGAKLDVRFRPEHQYLVALNPRHQIIGGIYYDVEPEGETAHLEKIVVADPFRKAGVADSLMNELVNRSRAQGIKAITTGFFRPEYFYAHGFKIESRYAGLVRPLTEDS